MSVPTELGSAYLEITTRGLDKAKKDLGVLKSNLIDSTRGQDTFNSRLQDSAKLADTAQYHFRGLLESVQRLIGLKLPDKEVNVKADGLDKIESGLQKVKASATQVEAPKPVHVTVVADKVEVAQPKPIHLEVEKPAPIKPEVEAPKPVTVQVQQPAPIKPEVKQPDPVHVSVDPVAPVQVDVEPIKPVTVPVEAPKPVTVMVVEKGIGEISSALAALKAPGITVEAKAKGIAQIEAAIEALKPHAVTVPLLASGLDEIQRGIDDLKARSVVVPIKADTKQAEAEAAGVKGQPITVPVKAEGSSFLASAMGMAGKLKEGVGSAFGTVAATPFFQSVKSGTQAAIDGFSKIKASISGALDRATDVPVLRQLKTGISYVNTKFDEFLEKRYGKLAKPIKYSGMAVDMGMMAMGHPIPGGAILGTIPGIAAAEGYKQTKDYMGRRKARQEKGEAPTLMDKGVNDTTNTGDLGWQSNINGCKKATGSCKTFWDTAAVPTGAANANIRVNNHRLRRRIV